MMRSVSAAVVAFAVACGTADAPPEIDASALLSDVTRQIVVTYDDTAGVLNWGTARYGAPAEKIRVNWDCQPGALADPNFYAYTNAAGQATPTRPYSGGGLWARVYLTAETAEWAKHYYFDWD